MNKIGLKQVIKNLKSVEHLASKEGMLDMQQVRVNYNFKKDTCGVPHCLAGWFTIAIKNRRAVKSALLTARYCSYSYGAEIMANRLGFKNHDDLRHWCYNNPEIWGNDYGNELFSATYAYNHKGFSGIIKHFEEVYNRL